MEKRKLTSVLLFFVLTTKNQKTGKRKSTSVLSFFVLCTEKNKKKTKTKIDFRFIVFVSLIRACVANVDIKMFRLCMPGGGGGAVLGIVGGRCDVPFFKW